MDVIWRVLAGLKTRVNLTKTPKKDTLRFYKKIYLHRACMVRCIQTRSI